MDKTKFFAAAAPKTSTVEIDGVAYTFRKLKQGEVERMKRDYASEDKALPGYRYVVSTVVLDGEGKQMFGPEDAAKLGEVDFDVIEGIATAAMKFSGLIKEKPAKN